MDRIRKKKPHKKWKRKNQSHRGEEKTTKERENSPTQWKKKKKTKTKQDPYMQYAQKELKPWRRGLEELHALTNKNQFNLFL